MKSRRRLQLEQLEDRLVPTGAPLIPWPNPTHLTLSFVPDGTAAGNQSTALFQTLDQQVGSASVWEQQILQAFQTWAVNTNMNIAVVSDDGAAIGTSGALQGDPRFGNIRVFATSITGEQLADSSGFDPAAGTASGGVDLNDNAAFGINNANDYDLYSVLLHEAGVSLGVAENQTPGTVMDVRYQGIQNGLTLTDIAALQSLYGAPQLDQYNQGTADNSFGTATQVSDQAGGGVGFAAVLNADITNLDQQEYFGFQTQSSDNYTFTVQSSGISMLLPQVNVYDANGDLLGSQVGTQYTGNTLQVRLTNLPANSTYYVEVTSGSQDVFGMGAYQLGIVSDQAANAGSVPSSSASNPYVSYQGNNSQATAAVLSANAPGSCPFGYTAYSTLASGATNYYKLQAPSSANGMTVSLWNEDGNSLLPQVTVVDAYGNTLGANVLVNANGSYTVQVPSLTAGATYYLEVSGQGGSSGDYYLGASFAIAQVAFTSFGSDQLTSSNVQDAYQLQVGHTQLFHFALSAQSIGSQTDTGVRAYIYDSNDNLIADVFAANGQTTTTDTYLLAGTYTVMVVGGTQDGSALQGVGYSLTGITLSCAIGPQPIDPLAPGSPDPLLTTDYTNGSVATPPYFLAPVYPFVNPILSILSNPQTPPPPPATAASTTTLTSSSDPAGLGTPVTFTATVTGGSGTPGGTVTFFDGATVLGTAALSSSGVATLTISTLSYGDHYITAAYGGSSTYTGSKSAILTQQIGTNTSSGLLDSAGLHGAAGNRGLDISYGTTVNFTATVTAASGTPSGTVNFMDGNTVLATVAVSSSGVAKFSTSALARGSHTITAIFNGTNPYLSDTSNSVSVSVY